MIKATQSKNPRATKRRGGNRGTKREEKSIRSETIDALAKKCQEATGPTLDERITAVESLELTGKLAPCADGIALEIDPQTVITVRREDVLEVHSVDEEEDGYRLRIKRGVHGTLTRTQIIRLGVDKLSQPELDIPPNQAEKPRPMMMRPPLGRIERDDPPVRMDRILTIERWESRTTEAGVFEVRPIYSCIDQEDGWTVRTCLLTGEWKRPSQYPQYHETSGGGHHSGGGGGNGKPKRPVVEPPSDDDNGGLLF